MTQPIQNISSQVPQTAAQQVFDTPDLPSLIFQKTQERSILLTNKASNRASQLIMASSWRQLQQALTGEVLRKRHPTLSSFIRSNQIADHRQLVIHLRKEAQDLDLMQTDEFQAFRTSTAPKYILSLDALIERTNFEIANRGNHLWHLLRDVAPPVVDAEPPEILNYETWNEVIQAIDVRAITELFLNRRNLTRIPYGVFQLQNLQSLWLHSNQLTALPPEVGQLQNLQGLYLHSNQLTALPPEVGQLQNLQALYLHYNQLAALPPQIGQLQNLRFLYLNNNQLAALLPEIGQLQNLRELNLGHNQLAALPLEITQLQHLQGLDLNNNQLAALLPQIGQLQNLYRLDLNNNQLAALPQEILQLHNLRRLQLQNNKLTQLPESFSALEGRLFDGTGEVRQLILRGKVKRYASYIGLFSATGSTIYAGIKLTKTLASLKIK